jgi:oxygen-independent coproporphyrinogen-3 oxidase
MNIYCINHDYLYETEKLLFLFLPFEKNKSLKEWDSPETDYFRTEIIRGDGDITFKAEFSFKGKMLSDSKTVSLGLCKDEEYELLSIAYPLLKEVCGYAPEWGMLTGVRPSKLMLNKIDEAGEEYAIDYFRNKFFASEKKTKLS